jgi:hypothetical protein
MIPLWRSAVIELLIGGKFPEMMRSASEKNDPVKTA